MYLSFNRDVLSPETDVPTSSPISWTPRGCTTAASYSWPIFRASYISHHWRRSATTDGNPYLWKEGYQHQYRGPKMIDTNSKIVVATRTSRILLCFLLYHLYNSQVKDGNRHIPRHLNYTLSESSISVGGIFTHPLVYLDGKERNFKLPICQRNIL